MSEPRTLAVCIDEWLDDYATTTNPPRDPATVLAAHDEGVSA